jgi:hypothetical protein
MSTYDFTAWRLVNRETSKKMYRTRPKRMTGRRWNDVQLHSHEDTRVAPESI